MSSTETSLPSWRDTATTQAIRDFVAEATREGDRGYVPPPERIAVISRSEDWAKVFGG
jgi:hypothetical protein